MTSGRRHSAPARQTPADAEAPLDPALLRFIEALARAHVDEDYAAIRAQAGDAPT